MDQRDMGERHADVIGLPVHHDAITDTDGRLHRAGGDFIPVGYRAAEDQHAQHEHEEALVLRQNPDNAAHIVSPADGPMTLALRPAFIYRLIGVGKGSRCAASSLHPRG